MAMCCGFNDHRANPPPSFSSWVFENVIDWRKNHLVGGALHGIAHPRGLALVSSRVACDFDLPYTSRIPGIGPEKPRSYVHHPPIIEINQPFVV